MLTVCLAFSTAMNRNLTGSASRRKPSLFLRCRAPAARMRFSLCSRASSSRSAVVRPVRPPLRSARARSTHGRKADSVRSNSRATAPTVFPSSNTSRTAPARNSSLNCRRDRRRVGAAIRDIVSTFRNVSTRSDQAQCRDGTAGRPRVGCARRRWRTSQWGRVPDRRYGHQGCRGAAAPTWCPARPWPDGGGGAASGAPSNWSSVIAVDAPGERGIRCVPWTRTASVAPGGQAPRNGPSILDAARELGIRRRTGAWRPTRGRWRGSGCGRRRCRRWHRVRAGPQRPLGNGRRQRIATTCCSVRSGRWPGLRGLARAHVASVYIDGTRR